MKAVFCLQPASSPQVDTDPSFSIGLSQTLVYSLGPRI